MFKTASLYRIESDWSASSPARLEEALQRHAFVPCSATQAESFGWLSPREAAHAPLAEYVGRQLLLCLGLEQRKVPSAAVRERLQEACDRIENETGRKPGSKRRKEMKDEILLDLLPKAFSKKARIPVWIDATSSRLVIGTTSTKLLDGLTSLLVSTAADAGMPMRLVPVSTSTSPAVAMAEWLSAHDAPAGFSIDQECELRQPDDSKASVRYARHPLDLEEITAHIAQGKVPTRVAMTWRDRVSFVLTDALNLRSIRFLDVVADEARSRSGGRDESFDADAAIATGELAELISDLIAALGEAPEPAAVATQSSETAQEAPWETATPA